MPDPAYVPTLVWDDDSLVWGDRTLMWDAEVEPADQLGAIHYAMAPTAKNLTALASTARHLVGLKGLRR